jgi:hypothetical protein
VLHSGRLWPYLQTLDYPGKACQRIKYGPKKFYGTGPFGQFFALSIYMAILSLCVIKLYYLGNYTEMAVNYHGKKLITLTHGLKLKYHGNLL